MTVLLELREKVKKFYGRNDVFIIPIVKFLLAFLAFNLVNGRMGYMTKLDNAALVLIAALACSFLPNGAIIGITAAFSLAHMYTLSLETLLVGMCIYLLMFLLYFRFSPRDGIVVVVTPILCVMKVPYVIPILVGLSGGLASAVSVGCGLILYFFSETVIANASTIRTMGDAEALAKIRLLVDSLLGNRTMMVMIVAFAITIVVVYLVRRMPIDFCWTIAMVSGVIMELVILFVGDLLYDTNLSIGNAILGALLALIAAKVLEFFRFCVDYSRTERVQFEDDEYYYYVKAIPKMNVPAATRTVKRINAQQGRSSQQSRQRSVVTERTDNRPQRRSGAGAGRSVTISGNQLDDDLDDFLDD